VVNDAKVINAFALPAGYIYITTGLLNKIETDHELAAVLAHEVGHVEARHHAKHIQKVMVAQGLTAVIFGGEDQKSKRQVAMLCASLLALRFSRHQELEADRIGIDYAHGAGYKASGMVSLLEMLQTLNKGNNIPMFLRTHPLTKKRIREARKYAARKK
jgi:predicted Zn-dependent protease